jgi:hypothetical protein
MTATTETPDNVVTDERALMLAQHAIYVQGGVSDPERERARAEADIAAGGSINWIKMQAEVDAAIAARVAAMPATPAPEPEAPEDQAVDVTAVLANVDQGEALRDRIKALTAELKIHEDLVKDALGSATVGTDAKGKVVVRFPHRNRTGLVNAEVRKRLSDEDYAACEKVTSYRTLLYGES